MIRINMFQRADRKGHVFVEYVDEKHDIFRAFNTEKEAKEYLQKLKKK